MKSLIPWILAAGIAGGSAVSASPDDRPRSAALPSAREILERNLDALGGRARFEAVRSIRLTATQSEPGKAGREIELTVLWRRPDRLRIEVPQEGLRFVQGFDGAVAWSTYPELPGFETEILQGDARELLREQADLLEGPTFDPERKGHHVELVGREELAGGPAWRILLTTARGEVRTLWFDCTSNLQVREERTAHDGEREVTTVSLLSDFRPVDGLSFAHRVESRQRVAGEPVDGAGEPSVFAIRRIELDAELPEALFAPPSSSRATAAAPAGAPAAPPHRR